jgi:hypothetical protein
MYHFASSRWIQITRMRIRKNIVQPISAPDRYEHITFILILSPRNNTETGF